MFQLFCLYTCKLDFLFLMRKKSQAPEMFEDFVRNVGAPNHIINDNSQELTGKAWLKVSRHSMIETHCSEPEHQN